MVNYEYHEAANIFPLDEDNIQALADDIAKNGQIVPVELCDGKIIDGRRRSAACRIAGVDPIVIEVKPADPVAYAWSINFHRRHLSPAQAAMAGARMREIYDRQAKQKQQEAAIQGNKSRHAKSPVVINLPQPAQAHDTTKTRDVVGKLVGVSGSTIDHGSHRSRLSSPPRSRFRTISQPSKLNPSISSPAKHRRLIFPFHLDESAASLRMLSSVAGESHRQR